ncbi:hypothetical protein SDC9_143505 [bioreactor metagenome]|uniref:Uncharacterized protein n=1 Tax=bioreactor metagenome TaxID=1076179 RepID=A0A645E4A2_9ZZZZ
MGLLLEAGFDIFKGDIHADGRFVLSQAAADKAPHHRGDFFANLDDMAVRIIETDHALAPAMLDQAVDIVNVVIIAQLLGESDDIVLFKIQLAVVCAENNIA